MSTLRTALPTLFLLFLLVFSGGCRSLQQWRDNGYKIGPNYTRPTAAHSQDWVTDQAAIPPEGDLDSSGVPVSDPAFIRDSQIEAEWWYQFNDPVLNELILAAYENNLDVKAAAYRVIQSRYTRLATTGTIFPQAQTLSGSFARNMNSQNAAGLGNLPGVGRFNDAWDTGFDLNWELDFWGQLRRSIIAADADYQASIEDLDDVLVTLVADVASTYLELRSLDQRIWYARRNAEIQSQTLETNRIKQELGKIDPIDVEQAKSNLYQTEATIPQLQQSRRQAQNSLSILLGLPPAELTDLLGEGDIPEVPGSVIVGIPADLMRRRPDIRAAERRLASQSEQIGIATADLFPTFTLSGSLGVSATSFPDLFQGTSADGTVVPAFNWNILNYGQLTNLVSVREGALLEGVASYQQTVIRAQQEVENAMAQFIYGRRQFTKLSMAEEAAAEAVRLSEIQWREGKIDYNQVNTVQATLVGLQDSLVQAELQAAQGLVEVNRALGGGWQIRSNNCITPVNYGCDPNGYDCKPAPTLCTSSCGCSSCSGQ